MCVISVLIRSFDIPLQDYREHFNAVKTPHTVAYGRVEGWTDCNFVSTLLCFFQSECFILTDEILDKPLLQYSNQDFSEANILF